MDVKTVMKCLSVDGIRRVITATDSQYGITVVCDDVRKNYVSVDHEKAISKFIQFLKFGDKDPVWIRYDLIGSYMAGVNQHPQKQMWSLGCKVGEYKGDPYFDFVAIEIDKLPEPLPAYISVLKKEP